MRRSCGLSRPSTSVSVRESSPLGPSAAGPSDRPSFDVDSVRECRAPYAQGPLGASGRYFPSGTGLRLRLTARHPLMAPQHGFSRDWFSALQAFRDVATLSFARPSGRSHRFPRSRDFVIRACTEFVSSPRAGSATRPSRPIVAADLSSARTDVLLAPPTDFQSWLLRERRGCLPHSTGVPAFCPGGHRLDDRRIQARRVSAARRSQHLPPARSRGRRRKGCAASSAAPATASHVRRLARHPHARGRAAGRSVSTVHGKNARFRLTGS